MVNERSSSTLEPCAHACAPRFVGGELSRLGPSLDIPRTITRHLSNHQHTSHEPFDCVGVMWKLLTTNHHTTSLGPVTHITRTCHAHHTRRRYTSHEPVTHVTRTLDRVTVTWKSLTTKRRHTPHTTIARANGDASMVWGQKSSVTGRGGHQRAHARDDSSTHREEEGMFLFLSRDCFYFV